MELFRDYEENPDAFRQSIVTENETMVLYYQSLSKRELIEWRKPGKTPPSKPKVILSNKKVMATVFWNCEGIPFVDIKESPRLHEREEAGKAT